MIKALCASLLLSATSVLPLASDVPDYAQPGTVGYDLNVVIDGHDYTRYFYNDLCYFAAKQDIVDDGCSMYFGSPNFIFPQKWVDGFEFFNVGYGGNAISYEDDDHAIELFLDNVLQIAGVYEGNTSIVPSWCFSAWATYPHSRIYYFEWWFDASAHSSFASYFEINTINNSLVKHSDTFSDFSVQVADGVEFHFDPLPVDAYDFLVTQSQVDSHPFLPRTQPKLAPDAVTNKDFNLWNTIRDFYVRFLFGGTDSQGVVYNKASFGSVPTSSFNVDVGGNSVSMGDWLSSTLTIVTFVLFVLVIVLVVRWIAVSIGNSILGVSGR